MLSILQNVVDGLNWLANNLLSLLEAFVIDAINGFFLAVSLFVNALLAVLPTMSDAPVVGEPTWLGWLNWLLPVSQVLEGLVALVTLYVGFLAIRYMLNLVKAL